MSIDPYTCFIIHADPAQRLAIRLIVEVCEPLILLGEAADGQTAEAMCQTAVPALVIWEAMDIPFLIPQLTHFHEQYPTSKIVLWGAPVPEPYLAQLLALGVVGYVGHDEDPPLVLSNLRAILSGNYCFSGTLIQTWLAENQAAVPMQEMVLSQREREILALMAEGLGNEEIAAELHLAIQTIRNYSNKLYAKLGISNRTEALLWAQKHGLSTF